MAIFLVLVAVVNFKENKLRSLLRKYGEGAYNNKKAALLSTELLWVLQL